MKKRKICGYLLEHVCRRVAFRMAAPDEDEDGEIAGKVRVDTRREAYTLYIPFGKFKNFFKAWKQAGVGLEPKS